MNAIRESIQPIYGAKKANLSRFNKLSNKINHFLVDESSLLKRSIRHHLRIGKQFNTAEKKTAVFNILADSKIPTAGINIDILFETWVKFKVTTRTGVKAGMTPENIVEVLNYNPLNLEYNESPFMLRSGL